MQLHRTSRLLWGLLIVVAAAGCRLDDDSAYAISTKAGFFLMDGAGAGLVEYRAGGLVQDWTTRVGLPSGDLSDAELTDNFLWLASGPQRKILQVSPTDAQVEEQFEDLPLAPHFISVGAQQILVADTAAHKVAMIKRRNGKVQLLDWTTKPGACIYGTGKFYIVQDGTSLVILDETAMSPRATMGLGMVVDEIVLSRYRFPIVMGHDSAAVRQAIIDANGDYLVGGVSYVVPFGMLRPTQYFAVRYGDEYLKDLRLTGNRVTLEDLTLVADSVSDFEADFFEGTLFYLRDGHFVAKAIVADSVLDSLPLAGSFRKGMYQYAD